MQKVLWVLIVLCVIVLLGDLSFYFFFVKQNNNTSTPTISSPSKSGIIINNPKDASSIEWQDGGLVYYQKKDFRDYPHLIAVKGIVRKIDNNRLGIEATDANKKSQIYKVELAKDGKVVMMAIGQNGKVINKENPYSFQKIKILDKAFASIPDDTKKNGDYYLVQKITIIGLQ